MQLATAPAMPPIAFTPIPNLPEDAPWEAHQAVEETLNARPLAEKFALIGPWRMKNTGRMKTHDGLAWAGDILKAGQKVGIAEDDGRGGMVLLRWVAPRGPERAALEAEFLAAAKRFNPNSTFEADGRFAGALADLADEVKALKRWCKTKVVFRCKGDAAGSWRTVAIPFSPAVAAKLRAQHPDVIEIVNEVLDQY